MPEELSKPDGGIAACVVNQVFDVLSSSVTYNTRNVMNSSTTEL